MGIWNDFVEKLNGYQGKAGRDGIGFKLDKNGNYDMQTKLIKNLGNPVDISDGVTQDYLKKYSVPKIMTENLDLRNHRITNLSKPFGPTDGCNKAYADALSYSTAGNTSFLLTNGSRPMIGNFDFNNHRGINLKSPQNSNDAVTKSYHDLAMLNKTLYSINLFKFSDSDFQSINGIQIFSFSSSPSDFHTNFHREKAHVVLSQSTKQASFSVNLGLLETERYSIRIEALTRPSYSGSLDLTITLNTGTITITKYKYNPYSLIINLFADIQNTIIKSSLTIQTNFDINKPLALFIYGLKSNSFVDPMILDNIDYMPIIENYSKKIRIPRYRTLEKWNRNGQIIIKTSFSSPDPGKFVSNDSTYEFDDNDFKAVKFIEIIFPVMVSLHNMFFKIKGNFGNWEMTYIDEKKGSIEYFKKDITFPQSQQETLFNIDFYGVIVSRIYSFNYKNGFTPLVKEKSYFKSFQFTTKSVLYDA